MCIEELRSPQSWNTYISYIMDIRCICKIAKPDVILNTEGGKHGDNVDTICEQTERRIIKKWKARDEWMSGHMEFDGSYSKNIRWTDALIYRSSKCLHATGFNCRDVALLNVVQSFYLHRGFAIHFLGIQILTHDPQIKFLIQISKHLLAHTRMTGLIRHVLPSG